MAAQNHSHELKLSPFEAPQRLKIASMAFMFIGFITFVLGFVKNPERLWTSYLTSYIFFVCLAVGAMFFIAFNYAAKAGWSVSIRRFAEAMTSFMPTMLIASFVLILGFKYLYSWADPAQAHALTGGKTLYLAQWFVVLRFVIFCLGCLWFRHLIVGNSLKQDKSGDHELTHKNLRNSIGFIAFFAIFFTMYSIDLLMSLLPTWYSTIFGLYVFSGAIQATMAVLAIMIVWLKNSSWIQGYVTEEHQHDVGKFLKGFTIFWAYIAFSQFMLIWYANIPEETEFYIMRSLNGWTTVSFALLIFRFIVPFLTLLPRAAKRNDSVLVGVSVLVLVMQYVDLYWLVYPNFYDGVPQFSFWEIGIFIGFAGLFLMGMIKFFTKNNMVAIKDPRMHEALKHHVTY
ncbi:MAG: molybdopterin oxidoreductase [Bdellovibrionales bacterium RIFCSPHIGHO2_01_FULL_40_29]|nr:MAG: molybdopterin oxidoreductase [Bdellovibrionales bacterium RIFCSPHIGHO2_01_FULL_40_29]OFZ34523.1 MAG: molybdopterin oxidoreductase [Bdellovibrionales bacterium RIFCSPHIGHO2_02_FULL_40_15]